MKQPMRFRGREIVSKRFCAFGSLEGSIKFAQPLLINICDLVWKIQFENFQETHQFSKVRLYPISTNSRGSFHSTGCVFDKVMMVANEKKERKTEKK